MDTLIAFDARAEADAYEMGCEAFDTGNRCPFARGNDVGAPANPLYRAFWRGYEASSRAVYGDYE